MLTPFPVFFLGQINVPVVRVTRLKTLGRVGTPNFFFRQKYLPKCIKSYIFSGKKIIKSPSINTKFTLGQVTLTTGILFIWPYTSNL